jgi:hypothetical protein
VTLEWQADRWRAAGLPDVDFRVGSGAVEKAGPEGMRQISNR